MLDHDFGKMCTCKYHLFGNPGYDGPFTPTLIDKWWPRYIKLEELFILYKIYKLAEKRDGSIIGVLDSDLGYLFMTYRDKKQVDGYITPVYINILQQAEARYHDFVRRGLLCGQDIYHIGVTYTAVCLLERQLSNEMRELAVKALLHFVRRAANHETTLWDLRIRYNGVYKTSMTVADLLFELHSLFVLLTAKGSEFDEIAVAEFCRCMELEKSYEPYTAPGDVCLSSIQDILFDQYQQLL